MPDALMLFAAGFGTRMGALTADRPKPLVEVAGKPLIDHALDLAEGVGPLRRVANAHYRADQLAAHLDGRDVALSREEPEILDTGGGLRAALPLLGPDPVFALNTDAVWSGPNPLRLLAEAWDPERMDALLLCVPVARAIGRKGGGDFTVGTDGRLSRGGDAVYTGAQIIRTDGLASVPEPVFSLNLLWNAMATENRLYGLPYPGQWCDVGHPEGITLAEDMLRADV
ncbi:MAG: nucleotidyltransferase family protein [Rhodobacteraceae bacterium]|jgi:MurNAc alpha-1-phosphate uridylyltransferase|uniref:MobA-like NTP transferase domain-containing protein n=1 Tax=Salipiger profundus TaxID=1229727 RepID=A0A1U7D3S2_9RHOB|nr:MULTISPECIES: nucleotidyltransferase family protein [Salipiger]APX22748.1 MobA-like NTP transferase domain-containing protein [Salipiger profundus]MAB05846.1 nucleotidyltransferase family protein [Paracoccaceae bacterium]GGA09959.1 nucleotidyltransferase [Salipiger profundus]SFC62174.1 MurNAc alpha-1-phosphate uridylyltransferase [Salipiger profundus]